MKSYPPAYADQASREQARADAEWLRRRAAGGLTAAEARSKAAELIARAYAGRSSDRSRSETPRRSRAPQG